PLDVRGRDAGQLRDHVIRLAGDALAVDDDVPRRLAEAALEVLFLDAEAGDASQHVVRRPRRELREIGRHVGPSLGGGGLGQRGQGEDGKQYVDGSKVHAHGSSDAPDREKLVAYDIFRRDRRKVSYSVSFFRQNFPHIRFELTLFLPALTIPPGPVGFVQPTSSN